MSSSRPHACRQILARTDKTRTHIAGTLLSVRQYGDLRSCPFDMSDFTGEGRFIADLRQRVCSPLHPRQEVRNA